VQRQLLRLAVDGPRVFRDLVADTSVPVVARAHALHLIWHRRLGIDLAQPLNDDTLVWPVRPRQARP
jgi:hypothetical protein